jgi:hypothetical protein
MTLLDVVRQLDELPDTDEDEETPFVIYAARKDGHWTADSPAIVLAPTDDDVVQVVEGVEYRYLLEVFLAKEVVEAYQEHHGTLRPTADEKLKAIIYYAEHDAYLPPAE